MSATLNAEDVRATQIDKLVHQGFPNAIGCTEAEYRQSVPQLPPPPPGKHGKKFPLPVLVEPRLTLEQCVEKTGIGDFLTNFGGECLLEKKEVEQFSRGPYWVWCNCGTPYLGKSVAQMKDRLPAGERWLTATECVFLAAHHPDRLSNQSLFCPASLFTRDTELDTVVILEPSIVGLTIDSASVNNSHPRYGCASCAWPPNFQWAGIPEPVTEETDIIEIGSPRLDNVLDTLRLKCAGCGKRLVLQDVMGPGGVIVIGAGFEEIGQKMLDQPYACSKCRLNFCAECTMKKAKQTNVSGYVCPQCAGVIALEEARPRVILSSQPATQARKWWQFWKSKAKTSLHTRKESYSVTSSVDAPNQLKREWHIWLPKGEGQRKFGPFTLHELREQYGNVTPDSGLCVRREGEGNYSGGGAREGMTFYRSL